MSETIVPRIHRARGYRLYTEKGQRLIDLFLDNGAALLGHRPSHFGRLIKNIIGRGMVSNLPSIYSDRLVRVLRRALPDYSWFGVAGTLEQAQCLVGNKGKPPADPLLDCQWRTAQSAWWRPLCEDQPVTKRWAVDGPEVLFHRLPFAIGAGPVTVSTHRNYSEVLSRRVGGGGPFVSPLLLVGAAASVERLLQTGVERTVATSWWPSSSSGWRRSGVYVVANYPRSKHGEVFSTFLSSGVLLNPTYPGPSILPGITSTGETELLKHLFTTCPGN